MKHLAEDKKYFTIQAMTAYGGSFVQALATAYARADMVNSARIESAFPDLFEQYGPGSASFRHARAEHIKSYAV